MTNSKKFNLKERSRFVFYYGNFNHPFFRLKPVQKGRIVSIKQRIMNFFQSVNIISRIEAIFVGLSWKLKHKHFVGSTKIELISQNETNAMPTQLMLIHATPSIQHISSQFSCIQKGIALTA